MLNHYFQKNILAKNQKIILLSTSLILEKERTSLYGIFFAPRTK